MPSTATSYSASRSTALLDGPSALARCRSPGRRLLNVTRAALPASGGRIVHIGSRGGFEGEPRAGAYKATKFAVAGISEALAAELRPLGVQSMVVEPGTFRTDFLGRQFAVAAREPPRGLRRHGRARHAGLGGGDEPRSAR